MIKELLMVVGIVFALCMALIIYPAMQMKPNYSEACAAAIFELSEIKKDDVGPDSEEARDALTIKRRDLERRVNWCEAYPRSRLKVY